MLYGGKRKMVKVMYKGKYIMSIHPRVANNDVFDLIKIAIIDEDIDILK
jgi:hypothetical protein